MNEETQILLKELVESVKNLEGLVEAVNSPDWWMIVLTIINIGAFIFVAYTQIKLQKQQTELQEQQTKNQEYAVYYKLFSIINDANGVINNLLNFIDRYLSVSIVRTSDNQALTNYQDNAMKMINRIDNNTIDFVLKFDNGEDILTKYKNHIREVVIVLQSILELENEKQITLSDNNKQIYKLGVFADDETAIKSIMDRISDESTRITVQQVLTTYVKNKTDLLNLNIASIIKDRITPTNTK